MQLGYSFKKNKILVTGGAGFIGSEVVRQIITCTHSCVLNVDALTYAGNLDSLSGYIEHPRYSFEHVNVSDRYHLERVFSDFRPDVVLHLAAETHVDRSINTPDNFVQTNVVGTQVLLDVARGFWQSMDSEKQSNFRFHHVSTDEVYGELCPNAPPFTEQHPYAPRSPYSASKAASDHLVRAWHHTYGLPVLITNCSNNYGPYQFPEKLIPLMILKAMAHEPLPVYGNGENVRDWLHVEDHARALLHVLEAGRPGRTYNIGGRAERTNLEVVHAICSHLDELQPRSAGGYEELIQFVTDRPGHDRRYAIDDTRISEELGWQPQESFDSGLRRTVEWYLENTEWVERVRSGAYREWLETNYGHRGRAG